MDIIGFSFSSFFFVLLAAAIRIAFSERLPRVFYRIMWAAVAFRLLIPVSLPSPLSVYNLFDRGGNAVSATFPGHSYERPGNYPPISKPNGHSEDISGSERCDVRAIANAAALGGSLVICAAVLINHLHCRRKYSISLPCEDERVTDWERSHRLSRSYSVRIHESLTSPVTYGIVKPALLLPPLTDMGDKQLTVILEHEYAHIRRFDVLRKTVYFLMLALHWFDPAVWAAYILMNRDIELSCDEAVIDVLGNGYRKIYAETLLSLSIKRKEFTLQSFFSKNPTKERIVNIMSYKRTTKAAVIFSVISAAVLFCAFAADKTAGETAGSEPTPENGVIIVYPPEYSFKDFGKLSSIGIQGGTSENISELYTIKSPIEDLELYSAALYEVTVHDDSVRKFTLTNSQTVLMTNEAGGWQLSAGDKALITLDIDLSDKHADKDGEYASVGYFDGAEFREIFFGKVTPGLILTFEPPCDGTFEFYLTNLSAGAQNYKSIKITRE